MAYSYDWFVARLPCPDCGTVSPADDSLEMSTYARADPQGAFIAAGDPFEADPAALAEGRVDGYIALKPPAAGAPIRLLNAWRCPSCGSLNWAEIVLADGKVASIEARALTRAVLDRAHFIGNDAEFVAAALVDSEARLDDAETLAILRERLPEG